MPKYLDQLKRDWAKSGYNGLLVLPIKTELILKGRKRHIISHNGVSFVWVNGDEKVYPIIFIPLKKYTHQANIDSENFQTFEKVLEYISLIALIHPNIQIDILHRAFKNYFTNSFDSIETQEPFYPKVRLTYHFNKQEFESIKPLTEKENFILSLFRDGNSSDNIFHSYLSFFRIFENLLLKKKSNGHNDWSDFHNWIDKNLAEIGKRALWIDDGYSIFINQYGKSDKERIGEYLVDTCRNAIAHANLNDKVIRSPSSFNDYLEIYCANEFIKIAARLFIKTRLNTKIIV